MTHGNDIDMKNERERADVNANSGLGTLAGQFIYPQANKISTHAGDGSITNDSIEKSMGKICAILAIIVTNEMR